MRDFQLPGRSPVLALNGMAATSHPLATGAALDCLKAGGNAVDAAVVASAVLSVVEPQSTGIGGDCFAIVSKPGQPLYGLNGSGRAASAATTEWYVEHGFQDIPDESVHSITVPGAVAAWQTLLTDLGTWSLRRAFEPAIRYAEEGFPVAPRVAFDWANVARKLAGNPGAARHLLLDGRAPVTGEVMRFPALGQTMRRIGENPLSFYEGEIAEDIVDTVRALGGHLTLEDLACVDVGPVAPVISGYRDLEIAELPPNGQGITALILLNILERFELSGIDPHGERRFHLEHEAARLAYACRDAFIADPEHMRVPVETLISKGFAASLADRIGEHRLADVTPERIPAADTVYLTVVDKDRMAVSFINSVYDSFGSGITTEKTGIALQNRGACFVVEPGHPNTIGSRKRPMHTIIPGFALRKGRPIMPFGVMGGSYQACGHAHFISNVADFGMDLQEALDSPRAFWSDDEPNAMIVERGVPAAAVDGLRQRGHSPDDRAAPLGGGQAILIDWDKGMLIGASDPRKDGSALGY
jgi:gamma-glutamyltranspeptidase/glutathione hydrolase